MLAERNAEYGVQKSGFCSRALLGARQDGGIIMRKHGLSLLVVLFGAILFVPRAGGHHSYGATYLEDKTITLDGSIVQMLFRNPHSYVQVDVKDANGQVLRWNVEWGGVVQLSQ